MDLNNNKICLNDTDCTGSDVCAFNKNDLNHYCIKSEKSKLYQGCLINNKNINYIESKNVDDMNKCMNFSRRQINDDGFNNNYFIYKPKKKTFVDTTTINIYLKCGNEVLAVIPYDDYFEMKCSDDMQTCRLVSKDKIFNFIKQNIKNTKCRNFDNIYIEYDYLCDNENVRLSQKIKVKENQKFTINISCPVNKENEKYQTKCASLFIDENKFKSNVDSSVPFQKCDSPVFVTPYIVSDKSKYEEAKKNKENNEKARVEAEINNKAEELTKLKIQKYMREHNVSYKEAERVINRQTNKNENEWITLIGTDAASYFLNSPIYGEMINIYDEPVKSIEEAKEIAERNNEFYFVWYHNNYNNAEYASKLFFINPSKINIFDKKILKKDQDVTTCIYNNQLEGYYNVFDTITDLQLYTFDQALDFIDETAIQTSSINNDVDKIVLNLDVKNELNNNIIKSVDNKITTLEQRVKMTNYETTINDQILNFVYMILFFVVIIGLITFIYMRRKYPNVNLIGK